MIIFSKLQNADLAAGALSVMSERERVIEFTVPYYDLVGITIMMKKPKPETSLFKFLTVLENSVWFCILGAYFFTSILMWIFDKYSPYSFQNNMETFKDDDEQRYFNFKECLWFCMTSLTPQVNFIHKIAKNPKIYGPNHLLLHREVVKLQKIFLDVW